ncbi:DNA ligase 4 [Bienertia sinuspersici]
MAIKIWRRHLEHRKDKTRVLKGQPWHLDIYALLLGEIQGRFNDANVKMIGDKIGIFIKVDKLESLNINKSMRLRVQIDVNKPLEKMIKLKMRGGNDHMVDIKYEKPPLFCFYYDKLGWDKGLHHHGKVWIWKWGRRDREKRALMQEGYLLIDQKKKEGKHAQEKSYRK